MRQGAAAPSFVSLRRPRARNSPHLLTSDGPAMPNPESAPFDFDVLVIGAGPAGQRAAIAAAKLEKRVGIIDRRMCMGGVCVNTGTIPSKT
ncbi:MAG: FAD-dependent oxidoreductase, partial [Pirellulales bacterium]|nr:FAD-dependent oxidoreductase [Pirellulales bacterium]